MILSPSPEASDHRTAVPQPHQVTKHGRIHEAFGVVIDPQYLGDGFQLYEDETPDFARRPRRTS
jgi:hypothetical protein